MGEYTETLVRKIGKNIYEKHSIQRVSWGDLPQAEGQLIGHITELVMCITDSLVPRRSVIGVSECLGTRLHHRRIYAELHTVCIGNVNSLFVVAKFSSVMQIPLQTKKLHIIHLYIPTRAAKVKWQCSTTYSTSYYSPTSTVYIYKLYTT